MAELVESFEACIQENNNQLKSAVGARKRSQKLFDDINVMCDGWKGGFEKHTESNQRQIDLLKKVEREQAKVFGDASATAKDRADGYKEEWDNSQNTFVFKGQDGFQHIN